MKVIAHREDGARLLVGEHVSGTNPPAVIDLDGQRWDTTVQAALARGWWEPAEGTVQARFDPLQRRDRDGKWTHDKLGLAGRLDDGETVLSSGNIGPDLSDPDGEVLSYAYIADSSERQLLLNVSTVANSADWLSEDAEGDNGFASTIVVYDPEREALAAGLRSARDLTAHRWPEFEAAWAEHDQQVAAARAAGDVVRQHELDANEPPYEYVGPSGQVGSGAGVIHWETVGVPGGLAFHLTVGAREVPATATADAFWRGDRLHLGDSLDDLIGVLESPPAVPSELVGSENNHG